MDIVRKVSPTETFRQMAIGETISLNAAKHGSFSSARSAVYRLNTIANEGKFEITTDDNGCNYTVKRVE